MMMTKTRRLRALALVLALSPLSGCGDDDGPSGASGVTCSATPTNGVVPLVVQFTASATSDDDDAAPLVSWSFGDGAAASVASVSRTYIAPGTYTAVAEVRSGSHSSSCSVTVTARPAPAPSLAPNRPPTAKFKTSPSPTSGSAPLTVDFNACQSSDPEGDRLLFRFDVFDGLYDSSHCRREHTYRSAGTYEAKVCVTDEYPGHEDICQSYTVTVR